MLRKLFLALGSASVLCLGCAETVAPSLALSAYRVISVDGESLPTELPVQRRSGCGPSVLYRSEFAFGADATFEQRFWFSADAAEQPAVFRTSFVQKGTRIELSDGAGSGRLEHGTLRLDLPATQICASMTWTAVLK